MPKYRTVENHVERRTYIKGKFEGKFIGYLDPRNSDFVHDNYYNIEIVSGEIETVKNNENIRHWKNGEPEEFHSLEKSLTKLPESIILNITDENGASKLYNIHLNDAKVKEFTLSNQLHEDNKVYGDISGNISGYLKHYDTEFVQVEIVPAPINIGSSTANSRTKSLRRSGKSETSGNYTRHEFYYSDGATYWGDWIRHSNADSNFSLWEAFGGILLLLSLMVILIPIIAEGWELIVPVLILVGAVFLIAALAPVIIKLVEWTFKLAGIAFLFFLFFGFASLIIDSFSKTSYVNTNTDTPVETSRIDPSPTLGDSIITHYRTWNSYDGHNFSGDIRVRLSDFRDATISRNDIQTPLQSVEQYDQIISKINFLNKHKLDLIYVTLDSLKKENNLSEMKFAEMIVSLVQDIPYTLILSGACNANLYGDGFIREYLMDGEQCEGNIKFGLLSPVEFMASLVGDCDTRTLLLFTVLAHYNYDVALLSSELYKHSILGINLPYQGTAKIVNGNRYVLWETTERNFQPGLLPREISDMRFWRASLISNNISI